MLLDADERPDEIDYAFLVFIGLTLTVFLPADFWRWHSGHTPTLSMLYMPVIAASIVRRTFRRSTSSTRLRVEYMQMVVLEVFYAAVVLFGVIEGQLTRDRWLIAGAIVYMIAVAGGWMRATSRIQSATCD